MARNSGPGKQKARTESAPAPEMEQILQKIRDARNFDSTRSPRSG